jgi:hypothetical protein
MGVTTVSIEWFRDLVVCIFGLGATVAVIILVVLAFLLYFRIIPILNSLKATTRTVENISSCVEAEVAKPLAQVAAFVQGIRQAIGLFRRFTRNKEED